MATLIAPLVSGIVGGGSGTAEFYRRGTSTPVVVYSDAEASAPVGKTVTLDANGGYELYADESVFVRVRSSLGVVVREFTVVHSDAAVDVESVAFTGTLASGSQGAGGRVDLQTLLDRWLASAGTLDFEVLRTGHSTSETLTEAFDNVLSSNAPLFNVRTYGAVGDGVTSDDAAFVACYNAAVAFGGGIIFLPGGNYFLGSAFAITSQKISMLGVGAQASIITSGISAGVAITINAGASTFSGISIRDLQITNSIGGANVTPLQIVSTPGVLLQDVMIKQFGLAVDIRSKVMLQHCDFTVPASATVGDYVVTFTSTAAGSVVVGGTFTQNRLTNTGCISLAGASIAVLGAKLDASAITPGAGFGIDVTAAGCKVVGCDFATGVAASYGLRVNANVPFYEDQNTFSGSGRQCFLANAILAATQIHRGSRVGRYRSVLLTANTTAAPDAEYEINDYISNGGGWALTIDVTGANLAANGCRMIIRYEQTLGAGGGIVGVVAGNRKSFLKGRVSGSSGTFIVWELVYIGDPFTGAWFQVGASEAFP